MVERSLSPSVKTVTKKRKIFGVGIAFRNQSLTPSITNYKTQVVAVHHLQKSNDQQFYYPLDFDVSSFSANFSDGSLSFTSFSGPF